jgi:asparagine synthase (glutamine-hydrolysing)
MCILVITELKDEEYDRNMCGIAGYINLNAEEKAEKVVLKKMTDCVSYRGPDAEGFYLKNNIAIGHRRLSIIDIAGGVQPMISEEKDLVLTFNGEIYNYIELREELKALGHSFTTNSDTEVIIKAYKTWGTDCQNKFNGMWAFALWDEKKQELFISRDRFGEKPLHYSLYNNTFVFGSEIKSLAAFGIPLEPRSELLEIYLTFTYIPGPDTFYKNIYKLQPGHFLILKDGKLNLTKYWDLPQIKEKEMIRDRKEVYQTFETLLKDSIRIRMRSDVPFGAFLSGGLDSSSIVSLMSKYSKKPVSTFTIGFNDSSFDESSLALDVAKKFKTDHQRGTVEQGNFDDTIKKLAHHFDEPFGDSSAIPTDHVSRFASEKVKMVLTGDGGDETLSGYISYTGIKLSGKIKRIPKFIRKIIVSVIAFAAALTKGKARYKLNKMARIIKTADLDFVERMVTKASTTDLAQVKELTSHIKNIIKVEDYIRSVMSNCTFEDEFYKLMYFHYKLSLPNDYLVKVDRMSMANSIETRLPFLDYRLVEFMSRVHKDIKMDGWERKSVLRRSIGKDLPASLLNAPKRGFGIPLREWFKKESFTTLLDQNLSKVCLSLHKETIQKIINENKEGKKDNGNFIWALLMLDKQLKTA